ncbi:MAG: UvrD-helicase domain-containing protein [Chloroflexota bacterium]
MASPVLERDSDIPFPHLVVVKASAGSGKTYALTSRYVQLALSPCVPRNRLRNILAVTFSNNAAKEMRGRILSRLKAAYFDEPGVADELLGLLSLDRQGLEDRSAQVIEEIFENYADFQVQTIDSFMTGLFKASALDFGYSSEFEITLTKERLMELAFNRYLRSVRAGSDEAALFDGIVRLILDHQRSDASYPWDPSAMILEEVTKIYAKVAATGGELKADDTPVSLGALADDINERTDALEEAVRRSGLDRSRSSSWDAVRDLVRRSRFADLPEKGLVKPPVNKPKKASESARGLYEQIVGQWKDLAGAIRRYGAAHACSCLDPYVRAYRSFGETLEQVKRQQGVVFIEDVNRNLSSHLREEMIPDVYFRLGEAIFHFLIDEFQDTSPIQWGNLAPLLENSLSQGGSLFVVGDTKQAIYGFRRADYRIMKALEARNPFPAARHEVRQLETNRRSAEEVVRFSEQVFKDASPADPVVREAARRSGLTDCNQAVREDMKGKGYVGVTFFDRDDESPPERDGILALIAELHTGGFRYGDIAVLTRRNEEVVRTTAWLNERGLPFVSYSSLDIRRRKVTAEIVSLLRFLDSPLDGLAFATFILGDLFAEEMARTGGARQEAILEFLFTKREGGPLYKSFQEAFPGVWRSHFEGLFRCAGYLPLYDLVAEVFRVFRVFESFPQEEATFVKALEVVKQMEGLGLNSLADFIESSAAGEGDESRWKIDVPTGIDAVKVMTIHKAKGLGFPAVIVLLYEEPQKPLDYAVEGSADGIRLIRLTRKASECDAGLETLYAEARVHEAVNRLNTLYVGFSRAEEELRVVCVRGSKGDPSLDVIPVRDYGPHPRVARQPHEVPEPEVPVSLRFAAKPPNVTECPDHLSHVGEMQRGDFVHRVLCHIDEDAGDLHRALSDAMHQAGREMRIESPWEGIGETIAALFSHSETRDFFVKMPGRTIRREQEYTDRDGRLLRMDRVVIDDGTVTVVDFKTGSGSAGEVLAHEAQVRGYMRVLRDLYPLKRAEGAIIYVDLGMVRRIA